MIDLEKMAEEHEKLFENCDLASQDAKIYEEVNEVMKELADVVIVCGGIYRFNKSRANAMLGDVFEVCELLAIDPDDLEKEVNRKWQVNLKRKWEWNGKTYKHVKGTGE